jgi:hypothetical protein
MPAVYYIRTLRSMPPPISTSKGDVSFLVSTDPTVTSYAINVYAAGTSSPILVTVHLGLPHPIGSVITVNIASTLNALPAGNYDVTIVATNPGGSSESAVSNTFTVPLV